MRGHSRQMGHSGEYDKTWFIGRGNGKLIQYSCHENPKNSMKRQKYMILEDESPKSEGVQYATGESWRVVTNSQRKNEVAGPKQKLHSVMDASGDETKVQYCKE